MKCHFLPRAQHEKPKIGHKTQKILIVGENKHQESIQRHQKPILRYLTWLYLVQPKILTFLGSCAALRTQNRAQNPYKILIVLGENKYQEWIQRHQKPLFTHLTFHNWSILIFYFTRVK